MAEVSPAHFRWEADVLGISRTQADPTLVDSDLAAAQNFLRQSAVRERVVDLLYRRLLGRSPDAAGKAYWVKELSSCADILRCVRDFLASAEFFDEQASGNSSFYLSQVLTKLNCRQLGIDEARLEGGAVRGALTPIVEEILADSKVRLRLTSSIAFALGLAELDITLIRSLADTTGESQFLEKILAALLSHPVYVEQARRGLTASATHITHLVELAQGLVDGEPDFAIRNAVEKAFPDRRRLQSFLASLIARSNVLTPLLSTWGLSSARVQEMLTRFAPTDILLSDMLPESVPDSRETGTLASIAHTETLRRAAHGIVDHWVNRHGRFLHSIDEAREGLITFWARRLAENEGLVLTFCEFLLSPVCAGCDVSLLAWDEGEISPAPGCFIDPAPPVNGRETPKIVATSYFYWYDIEQGADFIACPDTLINESGEDSLTLRPPTLEGLSYRSFAWQAGELADMARAGVNVVLPVAYNSPFSHPGSTGNAKDVDRNIRSRFADEGLRVMRRAWLDIERVGIAVPRVAMFYDTSTLNRINAKGLKLDYRKRYAHQWFYESVRNFFSHFPRAMWALFKGRPLVFVYHPSFGDHLDDGLFPYVRSRFLRDFGVDPYIVTASEEEAPRVLNADRLTAAAEGLLKQPGLGVLAGILSDGHGFRSLGGNETTYVSTLLRRIFRRDPTAAEVAAHLATLHQDPEAPPEAQRRVLVDKILHSDAYFSTLLEFWFRKYLRTAPDMAEESHSRLIASLDRSLRQEDDWLGALTTLAASPLFFEAAGSTDDYLADALFQAFAMKHPNSHCTPNYHLLYAPFSAKQELLCDLNKEDRPTAIRRFLERYEVREAIVSEWHFYYVGWYYPGPADSDFYWSAAISPTIRGVASIGPGYDQSKLKNRPALTMPRFDGDTYREAWRWILAMKPLPQIVHLESWNEFFEGTAICDTAEFGKTYIDLTRYFADTFYAMSSTRP